MKLVVKTVADPGFPVEGASTLRGHRSLMWVLLVKMYGKTKELGPKGQKQWWILDFP